MQIDVSVDSADWETALDLMVELCFSAGRAASADGADAIGDRAKERLSWFPHAPETRTPSPKTGGFPPGMITGVLRDSILTNETDPEYVEVGPTARYGRIQELGGPMNGHPWMRWRTDGVWHKSAFEVLPSRPYLKPATDDVVDSGELTEIYWQHWAEAQEEATG